MAILIRTHSLKAMKNQTSHLQILKTKRFVFINDISTFILINGCFFYFLSIVASLLFVDCPFQSSLSSIVRRLVQLLRAPAAFFIQSMYLLCTAVACAVAFTLFVFSIICLTCFWSCLEGCSNGSDQTHGAAGDRDAEVARPQLGPDSWIDRFFSYIFGILGSHMGTAARNVYGSWLDIASPARKALEVLRNPLSGEDRLIAMAFAWVTQTSTDPLVLADATPVVPEIRWSADMAGRVSLSALDYLLRKVLQLESSRGCPEDMTSFTSVSYSSAFLLFLWEKILHNPRELETWVAIRPDALRAVALKVDSFDAEMEMVPLPLSRILYFQVIASMSTALWWDLTSPGLSVQPVDLPSDAETICARAMLLLAQSNEPEVVSLCFPLLRSCPALARNETQRIYYLVALAIVCGYKADQERGGTRVITNHQ